MVRYILVEAKSSYNVIIDRRTLNKLKAAISTPHMAKKFLIEDSAIIIVKADPKKARQCYIQILKVASYSIKSTIKTTTHMDWLKECHYVETSDQSDLDPRTKVEEERPTFNEPMTLVQLRA